MAQTLKDMIAGKKKVTKTASRMAIAKKSNVLANRLAQRLEDHMEKTLADAEEVVKEYFPARFVSASLTKLQKMLLKEGISSQFDKRVTKASVKKTAKSKVTAAECNEMVKKIAQSVVDETEESLEKLDKAIRTLASKHFPKNRIASARAMRKGVEAKMKNKMRIKL